MLFYPIKLIGRLTISSIQNYVYADFSPWKFFSVSFCIDFDFFSVYCDRIFTSFYFVSQFIFSLCRVIFQQVC